MNCHTASVFVPVPSSVRLTEEKFPLEHLRNWYLAPVLGTEACLWTETVPRHRVMSKIFPRIFAYSECAWSAPEKKSYADLVRRRERLEAAGLTDYLKGN